MKYTTAMHLLGGQAEAARWLGMTQHAISNWQVDKDGCLTSRRVRDSVIAALTRKLHHQNHIEFADAEQAKLWNELLVLP